MTGIFVNFDVSILRRYRLDLPRYKLLKLVQNDHAVNIWSHSDENWGRNRPKNFQENKTCMQNTKVD